MYVPYNNMIRNIHAYILTSISTPAGIFNFINESIVCEDGS